MVARLFDAEDAHLANGKIAAFIGDRDAGERITEASVADLQQGLAIQCEAHAARFVARKNQAVAIAVFEPDSFPMGRQQPDTAAPETENFEGR